MTPGTPSNPEASIPRDADRNVRPPRGAPSKVLAFILSLVACGAGQIYLGRARRGGSLLALFFLFYAAAIAGLLMGSRAGLFVGLGAIAATGVVRLYAAVDALLVRPAPSSERPGMARVIAVTFAIAALGAIVAPITKRFLLESFTVRSGSSAPTLLVGDHVFARKTSTEFQRGRLLVYRSPEQPAQSFLHRTVAVGGDRVEMREGHLLINNWEVPRCPVGAGVLDASAPEDLADAMRGEFVVEFLDGEVYMTFIDEQGLGSSDGSWTVPAGEAFVVGDNRNNSHDSRLWFGGAGGSVPREFAVGHPSSIWLSVVGKGVDFARIGLGRGAPVLPQGNESLQPALDACLAKQPPRETTIPPASRP